jgi:aryl carrier-like protein
MSKKSKNGLCQPIKEAVELPFALAEIVAETQATMPHVAALADSALDVVYGLDSLSILVLPQEARDQIRQIVAAHLPADCTAIAG